MSDVIFKDNLDAARFSPRAAAPTPMGPSSAWPRRQPVHDDDGDRSGPEPEFVDGSLHPIVASALAGISPEGRAAPASVEDTFETLDVALRAALEGDDALRARIVKLEIELAHARAAAAELKSKLHQVDFIVERLSIDRTGPPGPAGLRGRDGPPGPKGEKGDRGVEGLNAPTIVSWRIDESAFTATPIMSNGKDAPTLYLRSMFETFNDAINDADDAAEADAARASRETTEQEAARTRAGLPR